MTTRRISTTDTAKLIRAALKAAFPKITFSVKSKSYSGGSSINVSWTDGPITKEVEAITNTFQGASFDGMTDLKSYHDSDLNGEKVRFGADYVFCSRHFSADFLRRRAARVAEKYGVELVEVAINRGGCELIGGHARWGNSSYSVRDLVMQEAYKTKVA